MTDAESQAILDHYASKLPKKRALPLAIAKVLKEIR